MTFKKWMKELERIGVEERLLDPPGTPPFLCPGSTVLRPYSGKDGLFRQCYESGMSPTQALGEIGLEQDWA